MPGHEKPDPRTTAILTLDCQREIVEFVPGSDKILGPAAHVLEAARKRKIPVIHVGLGFRPGYPEISPDNLMFSRLKETGRFVTEAGPAEFHPALAPQPGEITIAKRRVSAFSGNGLEMLLRARGTRTLAFFGIATSGIVLSTLRQAADMDFRCIVIKDCCFDGDEDVHRVLTEKIFPRQATVVDSASFIGQMG